MWRMPGFVRRAGLWSAIALPALAILGAALGWLRWQRSADDITRSKLAYADGDYRQAADLARRRLKAAPQDPNALRLLARATARLGRDAPANSMFARLGSGALETEDFYLLGLGLDRAGRKDEAVRVWETGIALGPNHAETLEQLVINHTMKSRLVEAAALAETLARQPGWERRGELELGTLRAELNDPAGAVAALRCALERTEPSALDGPTANHYRKLLARNLLRIDEPTDARAMIQKVLDDGADAEASWLLSRAQLQRGDLQAAVAAIRAAGQYRAEHPLELEPSAYVGEVRCAACHRDKVRAFQASGHASTFVRGKALTKLPYPGEPVPDPDDPGVTHAIKTEGDHVHYEARVRDQVLGAVVAYAFGSAKHYFSLVGYDNHENPYIFRLSHYQTGQNSGWVRTTGHSPDVHAGHDFLGKPIERLDGVYKCLFCHTTDPKAVLDHSGPVAEDRAIGCERCHGPGGNHLKAIASKLGDTAIVNPAQAPGDARLRICGQCHSNHMESSLPRTDPFWIRFQGTTLAWSRCYTDSAGAFDCMTCHDPHHDTDRSAAHYEARCLACHSAEPMAVSKDNSQVFNFPGRRASRGSVCPVSPADRCIDCHMPPFESKPLHATFADHYIRVRPEFKPVVPK
jgi:Flp pilus assembly protein TadD